eukprot:8295181-Pyramimonas_sp.AAC.1
MSLEHSVLTVDSTTLLAGQQILTVVGFDRFNNPVTGAHSCFQGYSWTNLRKVSKPYALDAGHALGLNRFAAPFWNLLMSGRFKPFHGDGLG